MSEVEYSKHDKINPVERCECFDCDLLVTNQSDQAQGPDSDGLAQDHGPLDADQAEEPDGYRVCLDAAKRDQGQR